MRPEEYLPDGFPSKASYTITEVARALGVHRTTVYRLIYTGQLIAYRPAASLRVARAILLDYLAGREHDPHA